MAIFIASSNADTLRTLDSSLECNCSDSCISAVGIGYPVTFSTKFNGQHTNYMLDSQGGGGDPNAPSPGCWASAKLDTNQWIQVSSLEPQYWTGVTIQGRYDMDQWVTQYTVQHSLDGKNWYLADDGKIYDGNSDRNTKVTNTFCEPVFARTIRISPQSWNAWVSLRFEAYFKTN